MRACIHTYTHTLKLREVSVRLGLHYFVCSNGCYKQCNRVNSNVTNHSMGSFTQHIPSISSKEQGDNMCGDTERTERDFGTCEHIFPRNLLKCLES
jgi:hypothetical protein